MAAKHIQVLYPDDDLFMDGVKKVREKKYNVLEAYTPFPVHGLDEALGLAPTRLAITSFIYGIIGLCFAIWMTNYMMIQDWPQNIGGKPSFTWIENMPAFVVIMFELTVFFSGHFMVITFYLRSQLWPFKKATNPDPRTTDNYFCLEIEVDENNKKDLVKILSDTGAIEIKLIEQ